MQFASRISKINKLVEDSYWSHVPTNQNAADCSSRGLLPSELANHTMCWNGLIVNIGPVFAMRVHDQDTKFELPAASSYYKLKRIVAYCMRFAFNCKNKNRRTGIVTPIALDNAETAIVKIVQNECFNDEIVSLQTKKKVKNTSALLQFSPFLDDRQILRVGGRLKNADLPFDAKHQILLPNKHAVTKLIILNVHLNCLHGPPKLTESVLKQKYWILHSQRAFKPELHKCVNCFKVNAKPMNQFMANLPAVRVNPLERPFTNTALDYTGAFMVKFSNVRGFKSHKSYVAIFVCMATRAMHIELVSSLTADAFIAAYRRLVARRGIIKNLYSDNGTNFVKSNKILTENMQNIEESYDAAICEELPR